MPAKLQKMEGCCKNKGSLRGRDQVGRCVAVEPGSLECSDSSVKELPA